ncbi:MAG: hypothetical protein ACK4M6_13790 [Hyphomonas sp.]
MFESVIAAIIRQAALLTKPQQEEFTTKAAEAMAALVKGTASSIDNELLKHVGLPMGGQVITKLQALI